MTDDQANAVEALRRAIREGTMSAWQDVTLHGPALTGVLDTIAEAEANKARAETADNERVVALEAAEQERDDHRRKVAELERELERLNTFRERVALLVQALK